MKTTKNHQAADVEVGSALERIVAQPAIHARFINTLSRLEYVGARKLMKSQDSSGLDRETLQHLVEETRHAWMLKKARVPTRCLGGGWLRGRAYIGR